MSLGLLLTLGLREARSQGEAAFRGQVGDAAGPALDALTQLPSVLTALDRIAWDVDAPLAARALLPSVATYLLREDDVVPAVGEDLVLGLVDDAYFAFHLAAQATALLEGIEPQDLHAWIGALGAALPDEARDELDATIQEAVTDLLQAEADAADLA